MTSLWRHLWPNYDTLDFKILTQCVKMLGERVLQVWRWYLHRFRRYRKKTRGGLEIAPPPVGRGLKDFSVTSSVTCSGKASRPEHIGRTMNMAKTMCTNIASSCIIMSSIDLQRLRPKPSNTEVIWDRLSHLSQSIIFTDRIRMPVKWDVRFNLLAPWQCRYAQLYQC